MVLNTHQLEEIMPHRAPMLLLDRVVVQDDMSYADATYLVKGDEYFLKGHFPGYPVVPGVILCEIMAQASAPLLADMLKGKVPFYTSIENARFRSQVKPGDTAHVHAKVTGHRFNTVFVETELDVDGRKCCSGRLSFVLIPKNEL